jgi:hypothetical protein
MTCSAGIWGARAKRRYRSREGAPISETRTCALAGAFAKARVQASNGATTRGIVGVVLIRRQQKRSGRRTGAAAKPPKKSLRLPKSEPDNRGNDLFARPMTPRPVQHGGGVEMVPVLHSIRTALSASRWSRLRRSPLSGETRRRSALFDASGVRSVAGGSSYPDGSAGTVGRCNGLRTRSLTVQPLHP